MKGDAFCSEMPYSQSGNEQGPSSSHFVWFEEKSNVDYICEKILCSQLGTSKRSSGSPLVCFVGDSRMRVMMRRWVRRQEIHTGAQKEAFLLLPV